MRVILLLIVYCASINADCYSQSNGSKISSDNMEKLGIYNKIFRAESKTSTYQIGICVEADASKAHNGAIIQKENIGNDVHVLGLLNQTILVEGDGWMVLTYEDGSRYNNTCANRTRSASIIFVCGQNTGNMTVVQEHCNYMFLYKIPGLCASVPQEKKKLSSGAVFLIIILVLASAYLIGGFLYMRIQRGARGIDQIPHLDMWRKLGNFAADGCDFCCRCKTGASRAGYFLDKSGPDMHGDDDILAP